MQSNDLFEQITNQLITEIETGATGKWRMPWHTLADAGTPTNADGRPYRGINALWLPMTAATRGWSTGIWSTYRGWQHHSAQVRHGEKATQVILWKPSTKPSDMVDDDGASGSRRRLIARTYSVFAAEQVDGADDIIATRTRSDRDTPERIADAEAYFAAVGARTIEGGSRAFYQPSTDSIHLPPIDQFDHVALYYGTRVHETVHWTGHVDRLDRNLDTRFGSDSYAAEELVAELGAAMWCAQAGLSAVTRSDHANYLAGWLRVLRHDARSLINVASKAQAAVDHLNQLAGITTTDTGGVAA